MGGAMVRDAAYPVGKHAVADGDRAARRARDDVPAVRLLGDRAADVVVPIEGQERAELHPAVAELLRGVVQEAARVRADHRDLVELELEHALDVVVHVRPLAVVVAEPVPRPAPRARERRPADEERPDAEDRLHREVRRLLFHEPPHVVHVQLDVAPGVGRVRGQCFHPERAETWSDQSEADMCHYTNSRPLWIA